MIEVRPGMRVYLTDETEGVLIKADGPVLDIVNFQRERVETITLLKVRAIRTRYGERLVWRPDSGPHIKMAQPNLFGEYT